MIVIDKLFFSSYIVYLLYSLIIGKVQFYVFIISLNFIQFSNSHCSVRNGDNQTQIHYHLFYINSKEFNS